MTLWPILPVLPILPGLAAVALVRWLERRRVRQAARTASDSIYSSARRSFDPQLDPAYFDKNEDFYLDVGKQAYLDGDLTVEELDEVQGRILGCDGDPRRLRWCLRELIDDGFKLPEQYAERPMTPYYQLPYVTTDHELLPETFDSCGFEDNGRCDCAYHNAAWSPELQTFVATADTPNGEAKILTSRDGRDWDIVA
jgi:hypothetical protein